MASPDRKDQTMEFVKKEKVSEVRQQLENYHVFRALTKEWVELSVKIAKRRKELAASL